MTLERGFIPLFNETGFKTTIDWNLPRREFAENLKKLFADLEKHHAAIPLPLAADIGSMTCLLASIDCKGCPGHCCNRVSHNVLLSPEEAGRFGIKEKSGEGQFLLPQPCKFFKKSQCSVYSDRPAACRLYPVQAGGSGPGNSGQQVIIGLDSHCPRSPRLGLRVYLVAYDLAHAARKTL